MSGIATVPTPACQTCIRARAELAGQALTDPDMTARSWIHRNVSDWQPGPA